MKTLFRVAAAFALSAAVACGGDELWVEGEAAAGKADEASSGRNAVYAIQDAILRWLPEGCVLRQWRNGMKRVDFLPTESYVFCASIDQAKESHPEFCITAWPGPDDVETRGELIRYHYVIGDSFSHELVDIEIDRSTGVVTYLNNLISNFFGAQKYRYAECGTSGF